MGTLVLDDPSNGTTADANLVANNNIALKAVINGGIDNSNIAAAGVANIDPTKLSLPSDAAKYLNGVGAFVTLSTPATVATTIAGLGTAADGKVGGLRLGATPFDFLGLVYDATYGKWVSQPFEVCSTQFASTGTTATGDFTAFDATIAHKAFTDAPLVLQLRFIGRLNCTGGGNTCGISVAGTAYTDGDTAAGSTATVVLLAKANYTTTTYKDTGWVAGPVMATPETMMNTLLQLTTAGGGAANVSLYGKLIGRWVG